MDEAKTLDMIRDLSNANGAPGFEDEVLQNLREYGKGLGEFSEDSLRNLYLNRQGNQGSRPVIQLDAHTDEVAFMVQAVKPNGTLRFIPLGGWVDCNLPAHRVKVRNARGEYIPGIIASKPPHFMTAAEKAAPPEISDMVIDIGASSREEAIRDFHIRIGEPVVPEADFVFLPDSGLMLGKAFDCRLGCASILGTLDALKGEELRVDIKCGFTVQEEMGMRGANVTSNTIKPDVAIVFEGCPADDTFTDDYLIQTALKRGPMLRHIDARMITNPRYQRFALDLAEKAGIPVQQAVRSGGATNGGAIHLSNSGVPTIVIGLPVRYAHTHYGISALQDYKAAVELASLIIRSLDRETIAEF